ncbi:MAG: putative pre6S rRNA nuclease [Thermoanaerobaculia bacterium]|jgi:putative Holliday junction resolvase|nr:putative pre6S rRNA nuclease [Thermoanaerobaculia bacterium]
MSVMSQPLRPKHLTGAAKYNPAVSIIAIDYGGRRIGVAVSDAGAIARPHSVVRNEGDIIGKLAGIARELEAETIVLGVPRRPHSTNGEEKFRDFAERLRQKTCNVVVLWDEALTTTEASRQLRENGMKRRDAQREIDMHAAAVILQSYLDDLARRAS